MRISQVQIDRDLVRRFGLYKFGELAWPHVYGRPLIKTWHLELICRHLEQVSNGEISRFLLNEPPGTGKSSWLGVMWPAWDWISNPWRRWMYASYDDGLVLRDARDCRRLVDHDWFQERWGAGSSDDFAGCTINATRSAAMKAGEYWTTAGGLRFSTTIGSKGTGWHAHIQVIDDPNKATDAFKDGAKLEDVRDWYTNTAASRRVPGYPFARVVDMQRLSIRDLSQHCIDTGKYHHLCLPMRNDPEHPYRDEDDPRIEVGELLCPALKDADAVAEEALEMGVLAEEAQHQQTPRSKIGKVFQRDWFVHFWRELPAHIFKIQSWDHTFGSVNQTASWVCGEAWGRSGADLYLIDEIRDRCEFPTMKTMLITFSAKHRDIVEKDIEAKAAGSLIVQDLKRIVPGLVEIPCHGGTGGKLARAQVSTGYAKAGNIWLPHPTEARLNGRPHLCLWVNDWIDEVCAFEGKQGDTADRVDTMSQAVARLTNEAASDFAAAMQRVKSTRAA